jgi:CRISPR-associated protein Cas5d
VSSNVFHVRIRGDLACFTRPEFKTERVSYDLITPSAARGVLEAVLWKPAIFWSVRRIMLLAPVRYTQFKRNEVNSRVNTQAAISASRGGAPPGDYFAGDDRAQRNTMALRDVDYAVEAEIVLTSRAGPEDNLRKFEEMFKRRLERGQFHMQPYLGCREFPAIVEPYIGAPPPLVGETRPLGFMLHDIRFVPGRNEAVFFDARLRNGAVDVPEWRPV